MKLSGADVKVKDAKSGLIEEKDVPVHPKEASLGTKKLAFTSTVLIEQADAKEIKDGEEVTLMGWGNAIVRKVHVNAQGAVTGLDAELHLKGDFKKTDKKLTWVPQLDGQLVPV